MVSHIILMLKDEDK